MAGGLILWGIGLLLLAGRLPFIEWSPFVVRRPSFDHFWASFVDGPPIVGYDLLLWALAFFSYKPISFNLQYETWPSSVVCCGSLLLVAVGLLMWVWLTL